MPYTIHRLVWLPELSEAILIPSRVPYGNLEGSLSVTLEGEKAEEGIRLGFGQKRVRVRVTARVNKGESLSLPLDLFSFLGDWQPDS